LAVQLKDSLGKRVAVIDVMITAVNVTIIKFFKPKISLSMSEVSPCKNYKRNPINKLRYTNKSRKVILQKFS
jgi:hypothetical protein